MSNLLAYLNWAYLPATLIIAMIWGGRDERIAVAFIVLAIIGTHYATSEFSMRYRSVELAVFGVDAALAVALIALTMISDRYWPIWATSFHLLSIFIHISMLLVTEIAASPYALLAGWWAWPTQLSLVIGVREYRKRTRMHRDAAGSLD